ncbi:Dihydrofolate synthetase [Smittium culicis]|uniref:Dihydrofolate synthetase n=1 Tax=Smittium culicis TaxID=133412 RepID=A0A1R1Y5V8_9FUNG|nr:Dihydrofolate synthetase [Smittium culicis]
MDLGIDKLLLFFNASFESNPLTTLKIVHVGGTNGKGSVCALIASTCQEAGYKTGTFNSPHLIHPTDSIRINNKKIPDSKHLQIRNIISNKETELNSLIENYLTTCSPNDDLARTFQKYKNLKLSNYEVSLVESIIWFTEQSVDIAILEVGVGGELDATNIFDQPHNFQNVFQILRNTQELSSETHEIKNTKSHEFNSLVQCLCSVDFDHIGLIGNNLREITQTKLGISRSNSFLVIGKQSKHEVSTAISEYITKNTLKNVIDSSLEWSVVDNTNSSPDCIPKPRFLKISKDISFLVNNGEIEPELIERFRNLKQNHPEIRKDNNENAFTLLPLVLCGDYQAQNAAIAYYALRILATKFRYNTIDDLAIQAGFKNVFWPGRLSWIDVNVKTVINTDSKLDTFHINDNDEITLSENKFEFRADFLVSCPYNCKFYDKNAQFNFTFLADGAHNPAAAIELSKYIKNIKSDYLAANKSELKIVFLVGFTRGKQISEILNLVMDFSSSDQLWAVSFNQPEEMPWISATDPDLITQSSIELRSKDSSANSNFVIKSVPNLNSAFTQFYNILNEEVKDPKSNGTPGYLLVVFGSLYLVSDILAFLKSSPWSDFC